MMEASLTRSRRQSEEDAREREMPLFEELFSMCFQGVYRFILARVRNRETAEDITSETFLRAWRGWPPRRMPDGLPKSWLFQIARNLVIDHYRAAKQQPVALDGEDPGAPEGRLAGSNAEVLAVQVAFAALSARDQEVLSLRLAGLSNREIATTLKVNEGAAAMACLRALKRLRERLED